MELNQNLHKYLLPLGNELGKFQGQEVKDQGQRAILRKFPLTTDLQPILNFTVSRPIYSSCIYCITCM